MMSKSGKGKLLQVKWVLYSTLVFFPHTPSHSVSHARVHPLFRHYLSNHLYHHHPSQSTQKGWNLIEKKTSVLWAIHLMSTSSCLKKNNILLFPHFVSTCFSSCTFLHFTFKIKMYFLTLVKHENVVQSLHNGVFILSLCLD